MWKTLQNYRVLFNYSTFENNDDNFYLSVYLPARKIQITNTSWENNTEMRKLT